jgi:hypothetical protein
MFQAIAEDSTVGSNGMKGARILSKQLDGSDDSSAESTSVRISSDQHEVREGELEDSADRVSCW